MEGKLKEIFNSNYNSLCNYACAIIKDHHRAEDLVQLVFVQLWESDKIASIQHHESYLLRCVRNKSIDYLRKKNRQIEISKEKLPDIAYENPKTLSEEEIIPLLHYFAAKLPPKTQRVFLLSRNDNLSYKEIAHKLGVSVKTVENQMGTALKKMRQILKEHQYLPALVILLK